MKRITKLQKLPVRALAAGLIVCALAFWVPSVPVQAAVTPTPPDYSLVFDAKYYHDKYEDLEKAYGENPFHLFNHFLTLGMREGRQANKTFNVYNYAANNLDLVVKFGTSDLSRYYLHYITIGYQEGRSCETPYSVSQNADPNENNSVDVSTLNDYVHSLVDMINQARVSMGINALGNTSDLGAAAALRAQDLMTSYSHNRPNGRSYTDALNIYGVKYKNSYEVIAKDYNDPSSVMNDWAFNSDISWNMTNKDFKYIGVGCAADSRGNLYWVLLLAS